MDNKMNPPAPKKGKVFRAKGQAKRLGQQQTAAGGQVGIFGHEAQMHDTEIGRVSARVLKELERIYPIHKFRLRWSITKHEINEALKKIDKKLGKVLFIKNASVKPDGGIIEVQDKDGQWRIVLVGESKHQGNDIEKIQDGVKQGKNKDADFMAAGNAIERVHKNIQEFRNLMLGERHFPYVVFLQGSNFITKPFKIFSKDGREIEISPDDGSLNRIDRVTASNFCMEINSNYCRNSFVTIGNVQHMLQAPSLYFQSASWSGETMFTVMIDIAKTSICLLREQRQFALADKD